MPWRFRRPGRLGRAGVGECGQSGGDLVHGELDWRGCTEFESRMHLTEPIRKIPLKVNVTPVPGETNLVNNSAGFEVRFRFSGCRRSL